MNNDAVHRDDGADIERIDNCYLEQNVLIAGLSIITILFTWFTIPYFSEIKNQTGDDERVKRADEWVASETTRVSLKLERREGASALTLQQTLLPLVYIVDIII